VVEIRPEALHSRRTGQANLSRLRTCRTGRWRRRDADGQPARSTFSALRGLARLWWRLWSLPVGRQVATGAAQRPSAVAGTHGIDGLITGALAPGIAQVELAGLVRKAAERKDLSL
jgi:hypothetical protein